LRNATAVLIGLADQLPGDYTISSGLFRCSSSVYIMEVSKGFCGGNCLTSPDLDVRYLGVVFPHYSFRFGAIPGPHRSSRSSYISPCCREVGHDLGRVGGLWLKKPSRVLVPLFGI
jgi:hypothetical protein